MSVAPKQGALLGNASHINSHQINSVVPSGAQLQHNWFALHVAYTEAFGSHLVGMTADDVFTKFNHISRN
jgi:hypothetical protein